jgi:hypothetical protein
MPSNKQQLHYKVHQLIVLDLNANVLAYLADTFVEMVQIVPEKIDKMSISQINSLLD